MTIPPLKHAQNGTIKPLCLLGIENAAQNERRTRPFPVFLQECPRGFLCREVLGVMPAARHETVCPEFFRLIGFFHLFFPLLECFPAFIKPVKLFSLAGLISAGNALILIYAISCASIVLTISAKAGSFSALYAVLCSTKSTKSFLLHPLQFAQC